MQSLTRRNLFRLAVATVMGRKLASAVPPRILPLDELYSAPNGWQEAAASLVANYQRVWDSQLNTMIGKSRLVSEWAKANEIPLVKYQHTDLEHIYADLAGLPKKEYGDL